MRLFFFVCTYLFSVSITTSQNIEDTLTLAEKNKSNFSDVLEYYKKIGEQEKYLAATFLIENMVIHESYKYKWITPSGQTVPFSELEYANSGEAFEVLEKLKDSLNVKPKRYKEKDMDVISSEMLIKHIDLAFHEWKNNPWSSTYNFDTFCEYILPYRSIIEPLNMAWYEKYKALVFNGTENALDINDPVDVATNTILELTDYKFTNKTPDPIPLLDPLHLLFRKKGSCPDLANLALFACRSVGLAATFDFTPHYAASSNRHFWNTIVDSKGKHIPFNGNAYGKRSGLPLLYNPNNKRMAKVFRRTFSIQTKALATNINQTQIPEGFLRSKNIKDVTQEYVNTGVIKYQFPKNDTTQIAFLNIFNLGKWRVIDWAKQDGKSIFQFNQLGTNIVYLPSRFINGKHILGKYPILLEASKTQKILKPDFNTPFEVTLSRSNEFENPYKDYNTLDIEPDKEYMLLYWDNRWIKIAISKATEDGVYFKAVPSNALFRLIPRNFDRFERIFTIDPITKKMVWY